MREIGEKVYCLDPRTKKIFEAEISGAFITGGEEESRGYLKYAIADSKGKQTRLEEAHVLSTKEEAEEHAERVIPLMIELDEKIEEVAKEAKRVTALIIGDPIYKALSDKIVGYKE